MNTYQVITTTGLIINIFAESIRDAISDIRNNGYYIATITCIKRGE